MRLLLFSLLAILILTSDIYAQKESPIDLEIKKYERSELGFMLGFGQNFQSGTYYVDCDNCEFSNGLKFGYSLGLYYEYYLSQSVTIGLMGLFEDNTISSSYIEIEAVTPSNASNTTIPVSFRHESDFSLQNITIAPYIKWHPANFFFLRLGFGGSFPIYSNLTHDKILLDRFITLQNGEIVEVKLTDFEGNTAELQNGKVQGLTSFQFGLLPAIGLDLPLSNKSTLATSFQYYIPFSNIYSGSDDFRINSWRIMFEFSYAFHLLNVD